MNAKNGFWLAAAICVTGCDNPAAIAPAVDGWEIKADAPAFTAADSKVSVSFTAKGSGMRGFGACLIADLHNAKACVTAADCATGAVVSPAPEHSDYCLAPQGESHLTCWTRNGADVDWCNKVPPPGRAAGTYSTPAVDAVQIPDRGKSTRWLAVACLNAGTYPTFSDGPRPPCASSDPAAEPFALEITGPAGSFTAP